MNEGNLSFEMIEPADEGTRIKVVGVGGAGGNAVNHMVDSGVQGVEFICANTDAQAIEASRAAITITLGASGLGAGSKPEKGCEAALAAEEEIRDCLAGANMVFITAGMGGGTGTGAAPVIARVAKELGILTVGVVTMPFTFEGPIRMKNAVKGLAELEKNVDSLIVVMNEKLFGALKDATQDEAFAYSNDVLRNAVGGIAEVIKVQGVVNVDFEDVKTVMGELGKAMMGTATASGPDRARIAAEQAIACPLLDADGLIGAKALLILISAARKSLKLNEVRDAVETACSFITATEPLVIYGTAYDEALGDNIRVTMIATGLTGKTTLTTTRSPSLTILTSGPLNANPNASSAVHGYAAATSSNSGALAASASPGNGDLQNTPLNIPQTEGMPGLQSGLSTMSRTVTEEAFPFQFPAMPADATARTSTTYTSVGGQGQAAPMIHQMAVGDGVAMGSMVGVGSARPLTSGNGAVQSAAVFHNPRTQKVGGSSNGNNQDITIPAFLRKQAD